MSKVCSYLYANAFSRKIFSPSILSECRVRFLYTESALGVDNYVRTRERVQSQFTNMVDKFKTKMSEFVEPNSTNMIFTEDLKNMLYIVESKDSDIDLVINMIKRFNQQNTSLRFGSFVFGPVVMRMFYYLKKPDEALKCFKDPELDGFFDQIMSYQVLMDLLYINERYADIVEVYDIIKSRQIQNAKYPKNVIMLTFAACYKQNNKDSYDYALKLWRELQVVGHRPMRKTATFLAALALRQGDPHIALEVISTLRQQTYTTVRNIKVAGLTAVGRPDDALPILKSILNYDDPNKTKFTFNAEVIQNIHDVVHASDNKELIQEFTRIEKILNDEGYISDKSLEHDLCTEIQLVETTNDGYKSNYNRNRDNFGRRDSFENRNNKNQRPFRQRPGLEDLV